MGLETLVAQGLEKSTELFDLVGVLVFECEIGPDLPFLTSLHPWSIPPHTKGNICTDQAALAQNFVALSLKV